MDGSDKKRVFFVGMRSPVLEDLEAGLSRSGISLEYADTVGPWRMLDGRPCHLVVIDLSEGAENALQLIIDSHHPGIGIPVLALVDKGDIRTAIEAIRTGAVNCLEKPLEVSQLLAEIQTLLPQADPGGLDCPRSLTKMETTVLRLILKGNTTSQIAQELHRSPRTIEVHRSHIMHKLDVSNPVELMKTAALMGLLSQGKTGASSSGGSFMRDASEQSAREGGHRA